MGTTSFVEVKGCYDWLAWSVLCEEHQLKSRFDILLSVSDPIEDTDTMSTIQESVLPQCSLPFLGVRTIHQDIPCILIPTKVS